MTIHYIRDKSGEIKQMASAVVARYPEFRILSCLRFLWVWKLGDPEFDQKEGMPLEAVVRKLPNRERDVYGKDIEVRVHCDTWKSQTYDQRFRLIFHELLHIHVEQDENRNIKIDDDGRVVFSIVPHDIVIRAFQREIEEFGVTAYETAMVGKIVHYDKKSFVGDT